ncbi:MAG: hypothetical protein M1823_005796 [Watsoniomyces obsoletus]|nr:MAG: hypothetical protein M1823_005796 [Watsoniomyces obsoletus]
MAGRRISIPLKILTRKHRGPRPDEGAPREEEKRETGGTTNMTSIFVVDWKGRTSFQAQALIAIYLQTETLPATAWNGRASFQAQALITIYLQTETLPATAWSFTSRLLERGKMAGLHRLESLPGDNKPTTGDPLTIDLRRHGVDPSRGWEDEDPPPLEMTWYH